MSAFRGIAVVLLAASITLAVIQKRSIAKARRDNNSLRQAREEEIRLKRENEDIPQLLNANLEAQDLRAANRDLLRLRNEVRQLRDQASAVEQLRQQNQRLASQIKSITEGKPLRLSQMEGYVPKETWSNAGFATPEAALQTFFAAVRDGRFERIAECLSPESRPDFEREFGRASEEERQKGLQRGLGQLTQMGGYRLAGKEQIAEDRVVLGIQVVTGGVVAKVALTHFGNEWKFHEIELAK